MSRRRLAAAGVCLRLTQRGCVSSCGPTCRTCSTTSASTGLHTTTACGSGTLSPATTPSTATSSTSASSSCSSARLLPPRRQAGPYELTTRWTMVMKFMLLPWKPELVFTGLSIMGVNPQNLKFNSHVDLWDSIQNNEYFSSEGLLDVFKQLRIYKTPDIETPNYLILKRTAHYEVRSYAPFLVVEAKGDKLTGSSGFNNVTGYIFGNNASSEKIPMTTPVFTQASDDTLSDVSIQIVLPMNKDLDSLPAPNTAVTLRKVEGGIAAVKKFSGRPKEEIVLQKEKDLRSQLLNDGLKPHPGCLLARYNDPRTKSFLMRNEVLIRLIDFTLEL
ncbi:hypothetical protein BDA96_10G238400 [Sorghum bicolor]|uniref:SOUL heme-binding protein n=1 Tax=Sorghum bicolor TaxID=4558 RepID=A0A921U1R7_SORBI|nr:hypothetical protein BDA96_10G238400 [Sorghum bicolor]